MYSDGSIVLGLTLLVLLLEYLNHNAVMNRLSHEQHLLEFSVESVRILKTHALRISCQRLSEYSFKTTVI